MADPFLKPTKFFAKVLSGQYGKTIAAVVITFSSSQILFGDQQFWLVGLLCVAGGGAWYGLRKYKPNIASQTVKISARQSLQSEIQRLQQLIVKLDHLGMRQILLEKVNQIAITLEQNPEPNQIQIALVGKSGVGKTAVMRALIGKSTSSANSTILSFPALNSFVYPKRQIQLVEANLAQTQIANGANLVVVVVSGDLTESENQLIQQLKVQAKPLILAFNQIDLYLPSDRNLILEKLNSYCPNPISIAANPKPITVRQYAENNEQVLQAWEENLAPQIEPLKQRLEQILNDQWEDLFYQNLQSQVRSLRQETETRLNQLRRAKAEPIIQRYQWLNAGAIFISPMPALDLFASSAINGQLLIELGKLYDQNLNWEQAKEIGIAIGKNLWQLGCIELATTAIATGLKSHTFTFAIGGTTQAICAAYITKVGAISFLDYLELAADLSSSQNLKSEHQSQILPSLDTLRQLCEKNFQKTQGISIFSDLISSFRRVNPTGLHP